MHALTQKLHPLWFEVWHYSDHPETIPVEAPPLLLFLCLPQFWSFLTNCIFYILTESNLNIDSAWRRSWLRLTTYHNSGLQREAKHSSAVDSNKKIKIKSEFLNFEVQKPWPKHETMILRILCSITIRLLRKHLVRRNCGSKPSSHDMPFEARSPAQGRHEEIRITN